MALTKAKKAEVLDNLKTILKEAKSVGFTTNTGLTVEEVTNLRVNLREVDSTFTLAKKTLIKIAFKDVYGVELTDDMLPNQIALVLSNDDAVAGLGKVNDFMKKGQPGEEKMQWTWAFFEEEILDAAGAKEVAAMPSRDTLLGRLVGSLQSPLSGFARFLDAAAKELESTGKENLGQVEAPAKTEEKTEEPKAEEKKEEAPKEEAKVEEKSEEAKTETDDLTKVEGIGPKTAEAIIAGWVATFAELAKKSSEEISTMIADVKGSHVTDTWPKQAEMAAAGKWDELKKWQDELDWGKPAA